MCQASRNQRDQGSDPLPNEVPPPRGIRKVVAGRTSPCLSLPCTRQGQETSSIQAPFLQLVPSSLQLPCPVFRGRSSCQSHFCAPLAATLEQGRRARGWPTGPTISGWGLRRKAWLVGTPGIIPYAFPWPSKRCTLLQTAGGRGLGVPRGPFAGPALPAGDSREPTEVEVMSGGHAGRCPRPTCTGAHSCQQGPSPARASAGKKVSSWEYPPARQMRLPGA